MRHTAHSIFPPSHQLIDPENNFYFEKLKTRQMLRENPNLIFIITLPVALIHPDTYLHQKVIQRNDFPWQRDTDGNRVPRWLWGVLGQLYFADLT